jgi:hypothetical protein
MSAWQRVLGIQPTHAKALRVLRDSHLAIGDYDGLTPSCTSRRTATGRVSSRCCRGRRTRPPMRRLKVDLSFRCAEIYTEKLGVPERAFRAYERILSSARTTRARLGARAALREGREVGAASRALRDPRSATPRTSTASSPSSRSSSRSPGTSSRTGRRRSRGRRKAFELAPARRGSARGVRAGGARAGQWTASSRRPRALAAHRRLDGTRSGKKKEEGAKENGGQRAP